MPPELATPILIWTVVLTCALLGGLWAGTPGPLGLGSVQVVLPVLFFVALAMGLWAEIIRGTPYVVSLMDWDAMPQALQFASLYVACLWAGFWWAGRPRSARDQMQRGRDDITDFLVSSPSVLLVFSALFIGLQLADTTLAEIWRSEMPRGFGQFDDWQPSQYLASFGQIGQLLCIVLSGIVWARRPVAVLLVIPFAETALWASRLSRGMFLPLLLFVFTAYLSGGKVKKWLWVIGGAAVGGLGLATLVRERVDTPGLYQMVAESYPGRTSELLDSVISGSTVVGVLSVAVGLRDESLSLLDGGLDWLATLLPVPTFLGWFDRAEVSLAHVLGIAGGTTGVPFPHLGELYYRLGWWGALVGVAVGMWFGFLQRQLRRSSLRGRVEDGEVILWYVVTLYGLVLSFHSATRAATRPLLYALLFSFAFRIGRSFAPGKRLMSRHHRDRAIDARRSGVVR